MNCPICEMKMDYGFRTSGDEVDGKLYTCRDDDHFYRREVSDTNEVEAINNVSIYWSQHFTTQENSEVRFQRKLILDLAKKYYERKRGVGQDD